MFDESLARSHERARMFLSLLTPRRRSSCWPMFGVSGEVQPVPQPDGSYVVRWAAVGMPQSVSVRFPASGEHDYEWAASGFLAAGDGSGAGTLSAPLDKGLLASIDLFIEIALPVYEDGA
jgi:hypothetical protein